MSWNNLVLLKSLGGLGLRNMEKFGLALAPKSCWRMSFHNSLWSMVMRVIYLKSMLVVDLHMEEPKVTRGGSMNWRYLISGLQTLEK